MLDQQKVAIWAGTYTRSPDQHQRNKRTEESRRTVSDDARRDPKLVGHHVSEVTHHARIASSTWLVWKDTFRWVIRAAMNQPKRVVVSTLLAQNTRMQTLST